MNDVTTSLAMTADDLPGYAGRLFDLFVQHPEYAHMDDWLNDQPDANDRRVEAYQEKIDEIGRGQKAGLIEPDVEPVSLYHAVYQIARSVAYPGPAMAKLGRKNRQPHSRREQRRAVMEMVDRLASPRDERT